MKKAKKQDRRVGGFLLNSIKRMESRWKPKPNEDFVILNQREFLYDCIFSLLWDILLLSVCCFFAFKFKWWGMFILMCFISGSPSKYSYNKKRDDC